MLNYVNQIKDIVTTQSPAFTIFVLHTKWNDAFDTRNPIIPQNLIHFRPLSGFRARESDFATRSAPAHYTAHHLHITWTDNIHWSFSKRFKRVQWSVTEAVKQLSCIDYFKGANCASVE